MGMEEIEYIEDWSEELAKEIAAREGIALTEKHLEIIRFARKFYEDNLIDPLLVDVERKLALSREEIKKLFPKGAEQISKIAGIQYSGCV